MTKTNIDIILEEDKDKSTENLDITAVPGLKEDIIAGMKEKIEDCIDENEIKW